LAKKIANFAIRAKHQYLEVKIEIPREIDGKMVDIGDV